MTYNLTPLEVCERLLGGIEAVAAAGGVTPKTPFGWRREAQYRRAGDLPSTQIQRKILAFAKANDIPLTAEHLIFGATVEEIGALLSDMSCETAA